MMRGEKRTKVRAYGHTPLLPQMERWEVGQKDYD